MAAADVTAPDDALAAADIICSLRGADLAGWTPPWSKTTLHPVSEEPVDEEAAAAEFSWPPMARGKRSRRRSPLAGAAAAGKRRCARSSPASPLDYSGGSVSRSGASTSGGEDASGFCSPPGRAHRAVLALETKVGSTEVRQLTFPTPAARSTGGRERKKLTLPAVQQLVRSLAVENESLHEEMRALQRACAALSKENDKLEIRVEQSNSQNKRASKDQKGKQQLDQQLGTQTPHDSFVLPDLNLPVEDIADGSVH